MNKYEFLLEDTIAKIHSTLQGYDLSKVRIAYSGGADSDAMMMLVRSVGYDIKAVFYNTGIEWQATLDHVAYMKSLGFDIDTIKAYRPVPTSNKKYGHPFISKQVSEYLSRLQKHKFNFVGDGKKDFNELYEKYPNCKVALRWWCNDWGKGSRFNIEYNKLLKEFLIEFGLPFNVSGKCCDGAKKLPIKKYAKQHNLELIILGIRKSEGGARAGAYKSCFVSSKSYTYDMFFPLFWWKNSMREWYETGRKITHSACYTDYGLIRTGCAGCPFGKDFDDELQQLKIHEPKLAKGIETIFNPSYEWTRKYKEFRNGPSK